MVSDFRRKKLVYIFKRFFDADESGFVEKKDFETILDKAAKLQGWKETDVVMKIAKDVSAQIWEGFQKSTDVDKDGKVTVDEWISMWDIQGSELPEWNSLFCKVCFHIQDATGDGAVDEEEFVRVHTGFGIAADEAKESFKKLAQGKTSVNWEEFQKLFSEFFLSDDENAPGNYIFGTNKYMNA